MSNSEPWWLIWIFDSSFCKFFCVFHDSNDIPSTQDSISLHFPLKLNWNFVKILCTPSVELSIFFSVFINVSKRSDILIFPSQLDSKVISTSAKTTKMTSPSPCTHRTSHMYTLDKTTSNRQPCAETTKTTSPSPSTHRASHIYTLEETTSNIQPWAKRTSTTDGPSKYDGKHEETEQTQKTGDHTHRSCIQLSYVLTVTLEPSFLN